MTREEAIDRLKEARLGHKEFLSVETLNMAIKALEQETILDKITEIIKPLRQLSIDEMSSVEWQILQIIDKYKAESEVYICR